MNNKSIIDIIFLKKPLKLIVMIKNAFPNQEVELNIFPIQRFVGTL